MKAKQIHEMTDDELTTKLAELKDELFNLRFRHADRKSTRLNSSH